MKKRILPTIATLLFSAFIITSCSLLGADGLEHRVYEGFYTYGFETNSFSPCGEDERWWVKSGDTNLIERYLELTGNNPAIVYARLEGKPSEEGKYGHMDGYDREFEVEEIIELRLGSGDDCN